MDQDKAAAFGGRMMEMISSGTLMMMTSVGHEVGLFETMAGMRPATSQEIATAVAARMQAVPVHPYELPIAQITAGDDSPRPEDPDHLGDVEQDDEDPQSF